MNSEGKNNNVFIVQDLHGDKYVQKSINDIIKYLNENNNIGEILLEGASGRENHTWLSGINNKRKNEVLNDLLDNSLLTGVEYYILSNTEEKKLKGLENEYLHFSNIKRLHDIQNIQPEITQELSLMKTAINERQKNVYSYENKRLLNFEERYLSGKLGTVDFYGRLIESAAKINDEKMSANLEILSEAMEAFKIPPKLHIDSVNKELTSLIKRLQSELPYKTYVKMAEKTKKFSDMHITYAALNELLKENYINEYDNLRQYLSYYTGQRNIDRLDLIKAEEYVVDELYKYNSMTNSEMSLAAFSRAFRHFERYFKAEATNFDYDYTAFFGAENFIKLYSEKFNTEIESIKSNKDLYEQYYAANIVRNILFAEKIEESLKKHNGKVIAVMGGFHTDGVGKILKSKNIIHNIVTPSLFQTSQDAKHTYMTHLKSIVERQTLALQIYLERGDTQQIMQLFQAKYTELLASRGLNAALSELNAYLNLISNVTEDDIESVTGSRPERFSKIQDASVSLNPDKSIKIQFTSVSDGRTEKIKFDIASERSKGGYASIAGWASDKITRFAAFWEWIYILPFSSFAFGSKTLNKALSTKLDSDISIEKSSVRERMLDIASLFLLFGIFAFSPPVAVGAYVLIRAALFSSLHKVYSGNIKQHIRLFFLGTIFWIPVIGPFVHYAYNESFSDRPASVVQNTAQAKPKIDFTVTSLESLIDKFRAENSRQVTVNDVMSDSFSLLMLDNLKRSISMIQTDEDLMQAFELLAFLVQAKTWLSAGTDSLSLIGPYQLRDNNLSSYERSWLNTKDAEDAIAKALNFFIERENNAYLFKNIESLYHLYFAGQKEKLKIYVQGDIEYISKYQSGKNQNSTVENSDLQDADKIFFRADGIDDVFVEMESILKQYVENGTEQEMKSAMERYKNIDKNGREERRLFEEKFKEVFFELNDIRALTDEQREKLRGYYETYGIRIYVLAPVSSVFGSSAFLKRMFSGKPYMMFSNYSMPNETAGNRVFTERNFGGRTNNYIRNLIFMLLNVEQNGASMSSDKYYTPGDRMDEEGSETYRNLLSFRAQQAFELIENNMILFMGNQPFLKSELQSFHGEFYDILYKASESGRLIPKAVLDALEAMRALFVFNTLKASEFHIKEQSLQKKLKYIEDEYTAFALTNIADGKEVDIDTKDSMISSMLFTSGIGVFISLVDHVLRTNGIENSSIIANLSHSYYEYAPYLNAVGLGDSRANVILNFDGVKTNLDNVQIDYGKANLVLLEPAYNRYDMDTEDIEGFLRKVLDIDASTGKPKRVFDKPFYVCIDRTAVPFWNIFDIIDTLPDNFHIVVYNSLQKLHENSWELTSGGGALLISGNNLATHKKFSEEMSESRNATGQMPDAYAVNAFEKIFALGRNTILQRIKRITGNAEAIAKAMARAAEIKNNRYFDEIVSHVSINKQTSGEASLQVPFIAINPKSKYAFDKDIRKGTSARNDAIADLLALLRKNGIYDAAQRNSYGFDSLTLAAYDGDAVRISVGDYPPEIADKIASVLSDYTLQVLTLSEFSDNPDTMDADAAAEQIMQILRDPNNYYETLMFRNHISRLLIVSHQKVSEGKESYKKLFVAASIAFGMIDFNGFKEHEKNYFKRKRDESTKGIPSYKKMLAAILTENSGGEREFFMEALNTAKTMQPGKMTVFMENYGIDKILRGFNVYTEYLSDAANTNDATAAVLADLEVIKNDSDTGIAESTRIITPKFFAGILKAA
ncbi:MAG: hypothetical protein LBR69_07365 [Endomicrobium sp.]|nr:hypothetical protein [Endomicrobium sp.]